MRQGRLIGKYNGQTKIVRNNFLRMDSNYVPIARDDGGGYDQVGNEQTVLVHLKVCLAIICLL